MQAVVEADSSEAFSKSCGNGLYLALIQCVVSHIAAAGVLCWSVRRRRS